MTQQRIDFIRDSIRDIPDFPKPGIVFKDITTLLADPRAFNMCLDLMAERYDGRDIDAIVGIESRGFIFGAALAARMRKAFIPARKPGKLPSETFQVEYELEYGNDAIEIHRDAIRPGERALIVDDLIATGGTAWATARLIERLGGILLGAAFVIELEFLEGAQRLAPVETYSLVKY
ncbi:MAG: adenine phosphoribosyltransferase [Myxococcales bacterium]|nr:adenine phosphoribosyltransferase [Myxococcales bacterium]